MWRLIGIVCKNLHCWIDSHYDWKNIVAYFVPFLFRGLQNKRKTWETLISLIRSTQYMCSLSLIHLIVQIKFRKMRKSSSTSKCLSDTSHTIHVFKSIRFCEYTHWIVCCKVSFVEEKAKKERCQLSADTFT